MMQMVGFFFLQHVVSLRMCLFGSECSTQIKLMKVSQLGTCYILCWIGSWSIVLVMNVLYAAASRSLLSCLSDYNFYYYCRCTMSEFPHMHLYIPSFMWLLTIKLLLGPWVWSSSLVEHKPGNLLWFHYWNTPRLGYLASLITYLTFWQAIWLLIRVHDLLLVGCV